MNSKTHSVCEWNNQLGMATTSGRSTRDSRSLSKKEPGLVVPVPMTTMCLHTMVFERLKLPKQIELFDEFEELSKTYSIEVPFLPRSQVELVFDLFDGKKLQSSNLLDDLIDDNTQTTNEIGPTTSLGLAGGKPFEPQTISGQKPASNSSNQFLNANRQESATSSSYHKSTTSANTKALPKGITIKNKQSTSSSPSSWSKLLSSKQRLCSSNRMQLKCCLAKSETSQDICLSPSNSSTNAFVGPVLAPSLKQSSRFNNTDNEINYSKWQQTQNIGIMAPNLADIMNNSNEALSNVALNSTTDFDNSNNNNNNDQDQDDIELKAEVMQLMGPLISEMRRCSTLSEVSTRTNVDHDSSFNFNSPEQQNAQQQSMILDSALDSTNISICLFDKRSRLIKLKTEAQNGRRWAKFKSRLNELCFKLTGSIQTNSLLTSNPNDLNYKVDKFIKYRMSTCLNDKFSFHERISKLELEQLIDLTKNSLNNLIDAQLLLRNKLTTEQQQQYTLGQQQALFACNNNNLIGNEYEILLRNNFNLLKIWQNIEETKRLVCFVCEPIKANLNDLFWFSRQHAIEDLSSLSSATTTTYSDHYILKSPLVSLDTIQVKRGLLQVSFGSTHSIENFSLNIWGLALSMKFTVELVYL